MNAVASFMARLLARRPWVVLAVGLVVTLLSVLSASRIQVKTAFKDLLSSDDPHVRRLTYLAENFPGAVTVQVLLEGKDPARMIEVAHRLEKGFLEKPDLVRAVYLEQEVDFFARHALLYLDDEQIRRFDAQVQKHDDAIRTLLASPSLLGILRSLDTVAQQTFPAGDSALRLSTRVSADLLLDSLAELNPKADVGVKIDPKPAEEKLKQRALDVLKVAPLPPSEEPAQQTVRAVTSALSLVGDALERGERMPPDEFAARVKKLVEVDLSSQADLPSRYMFDEGRTLLLMEVGAHADLTLLENIRPVLAHLDEVTARVQRESPDVKIGLTGLPVMYVQEQDAILNNFLLGTILAFLGILAVFIIGFEQVGLPLASAVPLVTGILWALGVQGLVAPELNMLNLLFPAVLLGLGVDFAIHILNAYVDRRGRGDDPEEAVRRVYVELVPGLVTGGVTTAAAFFVLTLASMKGLRALGFTAGVGVLTAVLSMLLLLPPLLVVWDRLFGLPKPRHESGTALALLRLGGLLERRRYVVLAGFLLVTCVLGYFAPNVGFERDATKVQPEGMPGMLLQKRLLQAFGITSDPSIFLAKDLEDAERIRKAALASKTIAGPLSITMAIPERQDEKRPLIDGIGAKLAEMRPVLSPERPQYDDAEREELRTRLAGLKGSVLQLSLLAPTLYGPDTKALLGALRDQVNRIDARLQALPPETLRHVDDLLAREVERAFGLVTDMTKNTSIDVGDVPRSLVERVQGRDGAWMVIVRANQPAFGEGFLDAHVDELTSISPEVTGIVPVWHALLQQILRDIPRLSIFVAVAIALLVLLGMRSLKGLVLALLPLVVALVWTIGFLGLAGGKFNFVSVLCLPILLGTGIDYGVHLLERVRIDRALGPVLAHSGRALLLSSLTTVIGFGSLMTSVHRGVFWLGLVTSVGIVSCLLVALVLLPALVAIFAEEWLRPLPAGEPPSSPSAPGPAAASTPGEGAE